MYENRLRRKKKKNAEDNLIQKQNTIFFDNSRSLFLIYFDLK